MNGVLAKCLVQNRVRHLLLSIPLGSNWIKAMFTKRITRLVVQEPGAFRRGSHMVWNQNMIPNLWFSPAQVLVRDHKSQSKLLSLPCSLEIGDCRISKVGPQIWTFWTCWTIDWIQLDRPAKAIHSRMLDINYENSGGRQKRPAYAGGPILGS